METLQKLEYDTQWESYAKQFKKELNLTELEKSSIVRMYWKQTNTKMNEVWHLFISGR